MHDWQDTVCKIILGHIVEAMSANSKLLIFDAVWQEDEWWGCDKDDEDMITGWTQSKLHMNTGILHMLSKLDTKSSPFRADSQALKNVRNRSGTGYWGV